MVFNPIKRKNQSQAWMHSEASHQNITVLRSKTSIPHAFPHCFTLYPEIASTRTRCSPNWLFK
jgi:hypothetical protein